ncbi:hypothetical protein BAUCODRAFT_498555 [Baudoinia panamericana UAMH 10762]|uniref:Uncharacterized protein n=1 Tax=Baudoinia panamericana (strain UAMH 10762) TaxID=717646 RepID=M2MVR9_BAUPA|nr:uncharacterized protein BAUCODRAFT_498555 [Baudoinia panamericana UAMH 10762]EMC95663.1 hypothetical protein BAUCODRAFT_498555 [Baudoinia panamericana UAMH 10762]
MRHNVISAPRPVLHRPKSKTTWWLSRPTVMSRERLVLRSEPLSGSRSCCAPWFLQPAPSVRYSGIRDAPSAIVGDYILAA